MDLQKPVISKGPQVLLWTARVMGTLIVLFVVMMIIGYAVNPQGNPVSTDEVFLLALFPVGMCVGYLLAWKCPLTGGILSIACIVVFLIALGEADMIGVVSFLGIPGILFIVYGVLSRRIEERPAADERG